MSDIIETVVVEEQQLKKKDFMSDQVIRWCPGCGDYSILSQVQTTMAELGLQPHQVAIISGIGCSSRFPYYMNTYGFHTIHGRAPAFATAVKCVNQDLSVWLISGDGDGLSIGGNHTAHILRRNVNLQFLLLNNRIYGLTKGQYSPTSEVGKKTKSTPLGSLDAPFVPLAFVLGAGASFIARTADVMPKEMRVVLAEAHAHRGTSFVEIYQNCNIFNDKAFDSVVDRKERANNALFLQHGEPMVFADGAKGIRLRGLRPEIIELGGEYSASDCLVHDETDLVLAGLLVNMDHPDFPVPFGVIRRVQRPCYDDAINDQMGEALQRLGQGDLQKLIYGGNTWVSRRSMARTTAAAASPAKAETPLKAQSAAASTRNVEGCSVSSHATSHSPWVPAQRRHQPVSSGDCSSDGRSSSDTPLRQSSWTIVKGRTRCKPGTNHQAATKAGLEDHDAPSRRVMER